MGSQLCWRHNGNPFQSTAAKLTGNPVGPGDLVPVLAPLWLPISTALQLPLSMPLFQPLSMPLPSPW